MQTIAQLSQNWQSILAAVAAIVGGLHVLLGIVNCFIPAVKEPGWFAAFADRLGALPQKGATGALGMYSPPLMKSRLANGVASSSPPVVLLFFGAFLASACGTAGGAALGMCELGKLSQTLQGATQCATQAALNPGDWQSALAVCGADLGPGQLDCAITAIVAAVEGRAVHATLDEHSRLLVTRLKVYLNTKKTHACGVGAPGAGPGQPLFARGLR